MSTTPPTDGACAALTREHLHRLLKAALPFTETSPLAQVAALQGIYIEEHAGGLRALATDRLTAALIRVPAKSVDPGFRAVIHRDDVKQLLGLFKATGQARTASLILEAGPSTLRVASFDPTGAATFALMDADSYPLDPMRRIFSMALSDAPAVTGTGFNPAILSRFKEVAAALGRGTDHMDFRLGSSHRKPALATIGEDFLGVVMPRSSGTPSFEAMTAWAAEFGVTAPALKDAS